MHTIAGKTLQRLLDERGVLLGCGIDSASPALAELAGMMGYDAVWADLEHLSIDRAQAENFCRGAKAGGALPLLRVPWAERDHVLHALEAGASVVVPVVEFRETAEAVVKHGKFAPLGMRGLNGSSRGLNSELLTHPYRSWKTPRVCGHGCGPKPVRFFRRKECWLTF